MPIVTSFKKSQTYETLIKSEKDTCQMLSEEEEEIPAESADVGEGLHFAE